MKDDFLKVLEDALAGLEQGGENKAIKPILLQLLGKRKRAGSSPSGSPPRSTRSFDAIHNHAASLRKARAQGLERRQWAASELDRVQAKAPHKDPDYRGPERHVLIGPVVECAQRLAGALLAETGGSTESAGGLAEGARGPSEALQLGISEAAKRFFETEMGDASEASVIKIAAAATIASGHGGDILATRGVVAAVNLGLTSAKAAFRVASGSCTTTEALNLIVNSSLAGVLALAERACVLGGTTLGAAVASAVAMRFAPPPSPPHALPAVPSARLLVRSWQASSAMGLPASHLSPERWSSRHKRWPWCEKSLKRLDTPNITAVNFSHTVKLFKFPLRINGTEVCSLPELRLHFNVDDVLAAYQHERSNSLFAGSVPLVTTLKPSKLADLVPRLHS